MDVTGITNAGDAKGIKPLAGTLDPLGIGGSRERGTISSSSCGSG
jgi:hypothetical protein